MLRRWNFTTDTFAFEDELKGKTEWLNVLNIELNLNEKIPLLWILSQSRQKNNPKENVQVGRDNAV